MSRREQWRKVLDAEAARWGARSAETLASELREALAYEVECENRTYQVEVQMLENTAEYVHMMVAVDDGSLPASLAPLTHSFLVRKSGAG